MEFNERRIQVIELIRSAFAGVSREGGVSLHEAEVLDDYGTSAERAAARERDTDQNWSEVAASEIDQHHSVLSFFDPIGFRYYLPAYMVWTLTHYEHSDSASVDSTIYALNLSGTTGAWAKERVQLFTTDQSRATYEFLCLMAEESQGWVDADAARLALASYWDQFGD